MRNGSTVQLQDAEILRLNADLERMASECAHETELRHEREQSVLTLRKVERDLQETARDLRNQLDRTVDILRKTEKEVQEAENQMSACEKKKGDLQAQVEELSLELEHQKAMIEEIKIVILKQVIACVFRKE